MDLRRGFNPTSMAMLDSLFHVNLMVFVDWPEDPLRFHLGQGPINWGGEVWHGFGELASVSIPSEAEGIIATNAQIQIIGVPLDLDGKLENRIRGREVNVMLALMDRREYGSLITDPVMLFQAAMSASRMRTQNVGSGASEPGVQDIYHAVEVDLMTGPSARAKASVYHSDEDQKQKHPDDTAGRLVILSRSRAEKFKWPQ